MKSNSEILNELFFKKKTNSYTDNFKNQQAQYTPVSDRSTDIKNLFTDFNGKIAVSDIDEVKKRLVGTLGMALGSNTVKSMASKAIKSFPIIVSDDISSETLVMIKNMMEEQYASYIDLLISNQIINIADYKPGSEDGNIAIQALNRLDGTEFGTGRIARQAQTGKLTIDDVMKNQPWWQLIRTNENYKSGNPLLDLLMEDAIIIPTEYENNVCESLLNEDAVMGTFDSKTANSATVQAVWKASHQTSNPSSGDMVVSVIDQHVWIYDASTKTWFDKTDSEINKGIKDAESDKIEMQLRNTALDRYQKYGKYYEKTADGLKDRYNKLITPYALSNDADLNDALGDSIAEMMIIKSSDSKKTKELKTILRDKFTKATYLLTSRRISGAEYISYLVDRLGIPVSEKIRIVILSKFRIADTQFKGLTAYDINKASIDDIKQNALSKAIIDNISNNETFVMKNIVPAVTRLTGKEVAQIAGLSLGAGAATGGISAGIAMGAGALAGSAVLPIILVPALAGALGTGIFLWLKKKFSNKKRVRTEHIEGWERVEKLIDEMDEMHEDLLKRSKNNEDFFAQKDKEQFYSFDQKMGKTLANVVRGAAYTESYEFNPEPYLFNITENKIENLMNEVSSLEEYLQNIPDVLKETYQLNEAKRFTISTSNPSAITIKNVMTGTKTKIKPKDIATIVPEFGTRDLQAYGSVEYDKRDLKDRKFNDPLILTIRFKERYADDKYSDNELTAVIGIKGVVTRVPSNEMETILKSNVEGKTLSNFFKGDESNSSKNLIGNVISSFMGTKYAEKLPTSGKIWSNLEKVGQLAIANKLSGNNNGNIANAHLVFSQKEIDRVRTETGVDYIHNVKLSAQLMRKYSAFMLAICDDALQKVYTFSDPDAISWDDAPYTAYMGKSNSDQLISAFTQAQRMRL